MSSTIQPPPSPRTSSLQSPDAKTPITAAAESGAPSQPAGSIDTYTPATTPAAATAQSSSSRLAGTVVEITSFTGESARSVRQSVAALTAWDSMALVPAAEMPPLQRMFRFGRACELAPLTKFEDELNRFDFVEALFPASMAAEQRGDAIAHFTGGLTRRLEDIYPLQLAGGWGITPLGHRVLPMLVAPEGQEPRLVLTTVKRPSTRAHHYDTMKALVVVADGLAGEVRLRLRKHLKVELTTIRISCELPQATAAAD